MSLLSALIMGLKLTFSGSSDRWLPYSALFRVTYTFSLCVYIVSVFRCSCWISSLFWTSWSFPSAQKARGCWVEWLISDLQKNCIEIFAEDCKDCIEILRREIFCSFSFVLRSNLTLNASEHWGPGQIWIESSARASRKLRRRMSLLQKIWKFVHLYFHRREQTLNQQMKTCHLH